MCSVLVAEDNCVAVNNTSATIGTVVFVFLFEACFTQGMFLLCSIIYICFPTALRLILAPILRLNGHRLELPA